jgi:MAF protein
LKILLASKSPRRRELLKRLYPDFDVCSTDVDENSDILGPEERVKEIALRKLSAVKNSANYDLVIAADTLVYLDGEYFGKPKDDADARRILEKLNGKTHTVASGVALKTGDKISAFAAVSKVRFKKLSGSEIENYVGSGRLRDKAGAYAIQDGVVVESYDGEYENIMGLPVRELERNISKLLK